MKSVLFALSLFFAPGVACAHSPSAQEAIPCTISSTERAALLDLDFQAFDQSLPNGGWRKYGHCELITIDLIDTYTAKHKGTLKKYEWDILVWHSGQLSAMRGDNKAAIAKMVQTMKPEEKANDPFLWNPYALGTVAFLERNKPKLLLERQRLARGLSPYNRINLRKIDAFLRCFESSYREAYGETCEPAETNIGRIRTLAIPSDPRKPGLHEFLLNKKVIIVGEIHGTKTVPEAFGNLVAALTDKNSKALVALEIPKDSQATIDAFIVTGNGSLLKKDPFFYRAEQDGRSSIAMVGLLRRLSKIPGVTILCMDPMSAFGGMQDQERDSGMAAIINKNRLAYDRTFVLTGNMHSRISRGHGLDTNYRPMGFELRQIAKDLKDEDILSIRIRYESPNAWTCDEHDCRAHKSEKVSGDYATAVPHSTYFMVEDPLADGHNATLFIRRTSWSLPFIPSTRSN